MKKTIKSISSSHLLFTLFLALLFGGCKKEESETEKRRKEDDQKIKTYLTEHNIQATKHSSDIYYEVISSSAEGDSLEQYDVVDFYYKMTLLDGTVIGEVSPESGTPVRFKLLSGAIVPAGLDPGINLMKVGDKFRFYIPSLLAHGDYQTSSIPANSIFIVDVEVVNKQSETAIDDAQLDSIDNFVKSRYTKFEKFASGLYYIDSIVGTGSKPFKFNTVNVNYTRKYLNGKVIKTATAFTFTLGYGRAVQGLEEGIMQMHQGGTALLVMPSKLGFGASLCIVPESLRTSYLADGFNIPEVLPYSILQYIVVLQAVY